MNIRIAQVSRLLRQLADRIEGQLRFDEQSVEPVQKEVPRQKSSFAEVIVQLKHSLQYHRSVHDDHVELGLETPQQQLQRTGLDCFQI